MYLLILWSLFLGFPLYFLRCWSFVLVVELRYVSTMLFKMASLSPFGITSTEDKGTRAKDIWFVFLQQFNVSAAYKTHPTAISHNHIVVILDPFLMYSNSDVFLQVPIRWGGKVNLLCIYNIKPKIDKEEQSKHSGVLRRDGEHLSTQTPKPRKERVR